MSIITFSSLVSRAIIAREKNTHDFDGSPSLLCTEALSSKKDAVSILRDTC